MQVEELQKARSNKIVKQLVTARSTEVYDNSGAMEGVVGQVEAQSKQHHAAIGATEARQLCGAFSDVPVLRKHGSAVRTQKSKNSGVRAQKSKKSALRSPRTSAVRT